MTQPLNQYSLPGVGEGRRRRLVEAGFDTLDALVAADPAVIAALPYFGAELANAVIEAARGLLVAPPAPPAAPSASELTAESLDRTRAQLREGRRLVDESVGERGRRKAARELRRVGRGLKSLRLRLVEGTLLASLHPDVQVQLARLEAALAVLLTAEAEAGRFRRARKEVRKVRKALALGTDEAAAAAPGDDQ